MFDLPPSFFIVVDWRCSPGSSCRVGRPATGTPPARPARAPAPPALPAEPRGRERTLSGCVAITGSGLFLQASAQGHAGHMDDATRRAYRRAHPDADRGEPQPQAPAATVARLLANPRRVRRTGTAPPARAPRRRSAGTTARPAPAVTLRRHIGPSRLPGAPGNPGAPRHPEQPRPRRAANCSVTVWGTIADVTAALSLAAADDASRHRSAAAAPSGRRSSSTPPSGSSPAAARAASGMDELVRETGLGKMTVYRLFKSKDDLVGAYLARKAATVLAFIDAELIRLQGDPRAALLSVVDAVERDVTRTGFRGCPFTNVSSEYDDPQHPARSAAADYKFELHGRLERLADEIVPGARRGPGRADPPDHRRHVPLRRPARPRRSRRARPPARRAADRRSPSSRA